MATTNKRSSRSSTFRAAAVCTPGLEAVCEAEMRALGLKPKRAGSGVLEFPANARQLYLANVWLRTASRVVVRVATFRATDFAHLQAHATDVPWKRLLPAGYAPKFRISTTDSKLFHTKAIAQRLHQVSAPPSIDEPEQLFIVRIDRNTVHLSIDASGEALHHRPWRTELTDAPLRTTMAAAMVQLSGWKPGEALIDPFCGAGTIGIEAALLASGMPPGGEREFAFHHWPDFDPGSWASVVGSIGASIEKAASSGQADKPIRLSDRDDTAITAAKANAAAAEVDGLVQIEQGVVSHIGGSSDGGAVVTNPPYGKRVGGDKLTALYRRTGAVVRERLPGASLTLVTSDRALARSCDSNLRSVAKFRHGGLPVAIYQRPATDPEATPQPAEE